MKLLLTGDWHIRNTTPQRRTDNYWSTVRKKIDFILDLAVKEQCTWILQPGDLFDSHKANDFLKRYLIMRLKKTEINIVTVFGQHDLRYHSSHTENTPLGVLNASEVVALAGSEPLMGIFGDAHIYGASWYEDIPETVQDTNAFNILIMHKMVIENEKLWDGQEDHKLGNILLKTLPYNLIVSGDNHLSFLLSSKSKRLVNCGSLLRSNIDQINHKPVVYILDIDADTIEKHLVPCEPFEQVFDMAKISAEKERNEKMEAFVDRLTGEAELEGLDFIKNMHTFVEKNKEEIDDATQEVIEEVMGD
jgi:DNA repair exonuclease SbcCD nuclease subunit